MATSLSLWAETKAVLNSLNQGHSRPTKARSSETLPSSTLSPRTSAATWPPTRMRPTTTHSGLLLREHSLATYSHPQVKTSSLQQRGTCKTRSTCSQAKTRIKCQSRGLTSELKATYKVTTPQLWSTGHWILPLSQIVDSWAWLSRRSHRETRSKTKSAR